MGLSATENDQYGLLPVFEALGQLPNAAGGVCMHQNILFLEFGYFGLWRTHLQNYEFWGPMLRPETLTSQSFLFIFNVNYGQKWYLKVCADARAICSTGFLFCTELFFNTKPLQKKHVPLKLGQLWLCQTFYSCLLSLFVECEHFCAPINLKV